MQEETNEKQTNDDWRDEVGEQLEVLKIVDMEVVKFVFQDEGTKRSHADFGDSVVFKVKHDETDKAWYVNANNFDLRKQIKELGSLTNMKVQVTRKGSKKSDTRYTIQKVE